MLRPICVVVAFSFALFLEPVRSAPPSLAQIDALQAQVQAVQAAIAGLVSQLTPSPPGSVLYGPNAAGSLTDLNGNSWTIGGPATGLPGQYYIYENGSTSPAGEVALIEVDSGGHLWAFNSVTDIWYEWTTTSAWAQGSGPVAALDAPYPAPTVTFTPKAGNAAYKGGNISGAEFTYPAQSGGCAPNCSYNYIYPQNSELDYVSSKGFGTIRMPLLARQLQFRPFQQLDPVGRTDEPPVAGWQAICAAYPWSPCQTNLLSIRTVLDHALADGLYVDLEFHDFGVFYDGSDGYLARPIGADPIGTAEYIDVSTRLTSVFKNYPNVIFGGMNEPSVQTAAQWQSAEAAVVKSMAAVTTSHLVLLHGVDFTSCGAWVSDGSAAAWTGYVPPAGLQVAYECHHYLDSDNSGTHAVCAGFGSGPMNAIVGWAQTAGVKIWIGEMGWSQDPSCPPDAANLLAYMSANEPTVMGWSYWVLGSKAFYKPADQTKISPPVGYILSAVPDYSTTPPTDAPQVSILTGNLP